MQVGRRLGALLLVTAGLMAAVPGGALTVLDDFERLDDWRAVATEGARVALALDGGAEGKALRIDFDFGGAGGHVLVRRALPLALPPNYALGLRLRAEAPAIDFELKLIDRTDANVWWYRQREAALPRAWTVVRVKKARLEFAWGPLGGGPPREIAAVEFAVTGSAGDRGSIWIDALTLEERPLAPETPPTPRASASTARPGEGASRVLDGDLQTGWMSAAAAADQWLTLDFGQVVEYGGLIIDWDDRDYGVGYRVAVSDDGVQWTPVYHAARGNGGRDRLYLPDGESRFIRLALRHSSRGRGYGVREIRIIPSELAASPNQFFEGLARDSAAGTYPKYFSGQQTYWTVIGADGDGKEAALNEEGMLEVERGSFSIEPFLWVDGRLVTWRDVQIGQRLEDGYLPIPTVTWSAGALTLSITAFVSGDPGESILLARYRLDNSGGAARDAALFLAVRPFQVLPPWQTLNMVGGVSPIGELLFESRALHVNRRWTVLSLTPPTQVGVASSDEGQVTEMLLAGTVPRRTRVSDPMGYASGALQYALRVAPQERAEVSIAVPYYDVDAAVAKATREGAAVQVQRALEGTAARWRERLGTVGFLVPANARAIAHTVASTLAYILINRDGPALQPGSRTYSRAWIRDGATTSAALLQLAVPDPVREFLPWYAGHQYADGKIPCCIDRRGADPLPEHDSNGEFLFALTEYYRYTRDIGLVHRLWPRAVAAVDYLERLRGQRLTPPYEAADQRAFYGLLPESVSHEGYASRPVHSYWDDFFALRGLKDAGWLAAAVDDPAQVRRATALHDALQRDVHASIARVMEARRLDYIPASAELADFDPSSTAIALYPGGEQARLPGAALTHTFERYHDELRRRADASSPWEAYAPYELRTVGALVRLGQRARAVDILERLLEGRRPAAWNQWAEVVWRDAASPKFIGDMPHTWVGSAFIDAVRTLFAYERDEDDALVLAAGLPRAWVEADGGTGVRRLPTYYGVLSYQIEAAGAAATHMVVSGDATRPPGGFVVMPPLPAPLRTATVNGRPATSLDGRSLVVDALPADILMEH